MSKIISDSGKCYENNETWKNIGKKNICGVELRLLYEDIYGRSALWAETRMRKCEPYRNLQEQHFRNRGHQIQRPLEGNSYYVFEKQKGGWWDWR